MSFKAFSSSLSGSLSTKAELVGVDFGSSTCTQLAATLMGLIKDGLECTKLDADSKKCRFFCRPLNDCVPSLELCAPCAVDCIQDCCYDLSQSEDLQLVYRYAILPCMLPLAVVVLMVVYTLGGTIGIHYTTPYYTTTYSSSSYYTDAPKYYPTQAPEY